MGIWYKQEIARIWYNIWVRPNRTTIDLRTTGLLSWHAKKGGTWAILWGYILIISKQMTPGTQRPHMYHFVFWCKSSEPHGAVYPTEYGDEPLVSPHHLITYSVGDFSSYSSSWVRNVRRRRISDSGRVHPIGPRAVEAGYWRTRARPAASKKKRSSTAFHPGDSQVPSGKLTVCELENGP